MKRKSAKILLEKYKKNICKKKECILVDNEENFPEDLRNTNNASKITDLFAKSCRDEIVAKVVSWTIFPHHLHSGSYDYVTVKNFGYLIKNLLANHRYLGAYRFALKCSH